jgi:hypothetical protein
MTEGEPDAPAVEPSEGDPAPEPEAPTDGDATEDLEPTPDTEEPAADAEEPESESVASESDGGQESERTSEAGESSRTDSEAEREEPSEVPAHTEETKDGDRDSSSVASSVRSSVDSESENPEAHGFDDEESLDPEFKRKFAAARAEFIQLRNASIVVQRKLLEMFPALGFDDSSSPGGVSDFPHRYQDALERLESRRLEYEQTKAHNEEVLKTLQEQCAEADHRRLEREEAFLHLREDSGRKSIMSRTNKPIRPTDLNTKESLLSSKNFELELVRIEFIRTKNKHKQTEDELNKQDQLSEGLHLIDFEQLKIENQSLNEKKAGKNQDLVKIEDKIKINAHMLTHVKEKLAFVRRQKVSMQQSRQDMEESYGQARAKLAAAKIRRDSVRDENSTLKKSSGLIGMTDLLYDFEHRTNELESMQERVSELKTRFNDLLALQRELEAKIAQRQPIDPSLLKINR